MLTKITITRAGNAEVYALYPSGLLIDADDESLDMAGLDALPMALTPTTAVWNRMVTVNETVRKILGLNPEWIKKL